VTTGGPRGAERSSPTPLPTPPSTALVPGPRRPTEGAPGEAGRPPLRERPRRRSRRTPAVVVLLVITALSALALSAHLWAAAQAWRSQALEVEAQRDRLASTSVELQQHLDEVQAALDASDARVEQLAAEKARAADLREAGSR